MPPIPQTESECNARGGHWTTLGLPDADKPKTCDLKTSDSGKRCFDSSECEGSCIAPDHIQSGHTASGLCSEYVSNFGNLRLVEDGKVELLNVE
jgi:hypothetical protein